MPSRGHGGVLALLSHVELLVLAATIAASMALGLCIARATLLLVFSLVTRGGFATDVVGSTTSNELLYENQTIRYASPVA
jgi:hypothetical protein